VPLPALTFAPLEGDPGPAVARVPAGPGVGQLLGPEGRSLLLSPAPNLRKWFASHLGLGPAPAPGRRPKTNLSGVATTLAWARTSGPFAQRLLLERLMAGVVPLEARRELRPPVFLRLDATERFPRVLVREGEAGESAFGPFPGRRAAERTRDALNRRFGLRPCDYVFEPDPALALGLGCVYAQVRSCAAPCLARASEPEYRALAEHAARWLSVPAVREDDADAIPPTAGAATARALVVDAGRREVGLFPVRGGRVLDDAAVEAAPADVDDAVGRLTWPAVPGPSDWPWLADWIGSARGRGTFILVAAPDDREALRVAVRAALPARLALPPDDGGNVRASQGET